MSEHHAQWSLSQEGLHTISWKTFCPEHVNPVLRHMTKIYALATQHDVLHQPSSHGQPPVVLEDRTNGLKHQSALLTRWINLSDPNFTCDHIFLENPMSQFTSEPASLIAHATFNYLLFIFLSVRTEDPLLKALMKSFAHQELHHIQSTQIFTSRLTSHQSTGCFWTGLGQIFQKKIEALVKFDAALRNPKMTSHVSDLSALYPYFPPKWLFKITRAHLVFNKPIEAVERYIRAIF